MKTAEFSSNEFSDIKAISARNVEILKETDGKINNTGGTKRKTPKSGHPPSLLLHLDFLVKLRSEVSATDLSNTKADRHRLSMGAYCH